MVQNGKNAGINSITGVAFHWYSGPQFDNLESAVKAHPGVFFLASEACNCPPSIDNWQHGESYGYDIIGDLQAGAVGWTDWNMLLDMQGGPNHLHNYCDAPILANVDNQTLHYQPHFYYMGHFSKFLQPDSARVATSWSKDGVPVTAVQLPDGQHTVVVVMNNNSAAFTFKLTDDASGRAAEITMPAKSIITLTYQ